MAIVHMDLWSRWTNNSPWIDMSPHSDTLSWFRVNQFLIFLLIVVCVVVKQQYQFYSLWFDTIGLEPMIYHIRGMRSNHYTTDRVAYCRELITTSDRATTFWQGAMPAFTLITPCPFRNHTLAFFVSHSHLYLIVVIVVHPVFWSPFCFISFLFIAMLAPPMILNNQLIYSINTPLAIYLICSLWVAWLVITELQIIFKSKG